jgi:hypothetical protein
LIALGVAGCMLPSLLAGQAPTKLAGLWIALTARRAG